MSNQSAAVAVGLAVLALAHRFRPIRRRELVAAREHSTRPRRGQRRPDATRWASLLDVIAHEARSGHSLATSVQRGLSRLPTDGEVVAPGRQVLDMRGAHGTDPDEAVVLHSLQLADSLGGNVAAILQSGVSVLRDRDRVRADAVVQGAQARLSARVLTAVPLAFTTWCALSSRSFRSALCSPAGLVAAGAGTLLNVAGWWWMRHLIGTTTR